MLFGQTTRVLNAIVFLVCFLLLFNRQALSQEAYRLIKSDYFVENPLFQNYVNKNKLRQTVTREGNLIRTTTYDAKGAVFQDMYCSDFNGNVVKDESLGTYSTTGFSGKIISPLATKPSTIALGCGDFYVGYLEAGSYYTKDGLIFTGFMLPVLKEFGNGSVLFMEDTRNKKCAWALIVDGNIDWSLPANIEEKPDVEQLHQGFNREFKMIADLPRGRLHLQQKKNPVVNQFMSELAMVNISPKNTADFNGYGLLMVTQSADAVADQVQVFVGKFKNNLLNGIGYYATLKNVWQEVRYTDKRRYEITLQSVNAVFGYFKQNKLLQGRTIDVFEKSKDLDYWSATNYPGVLYAPYQRKGKQLDYQTVNLSSLPSKITIYIPSVDREFAAEVDKNSGVLKIRSDFSESSSKPLIQNLDGKEELIYYKTSIPYTVTNNCPKQYREPIYETRQESYVAYYQHSSRREEVNFGDYIRVYSTSTSSPVYKTKEVGYFTGRYEVKTCLYCKGTGVINSNYTRIAYQPINFNIRQLGIHQLSGLNKQNLYSKKNYMETKAVMVYESIREKKAADLAFTVQLLDELAQNRYGPGEEAKTKTYAGIVDELLFFEEPQMAETFLRYFPPVRRALILQKLSAEATSYFNKVKW